MKPRPKSMALAVIAGAFLAVAPLQIALQPGAFLAGEAMAAESAGNPTEELPLFPVKGMVTMVDLGSGTCIPCKMMTPILGKLRQSYDGKAAIVFVDLRYHREQARKLKIRAIPTQVFFNPQGQEVTRHVGFMSEEAIVQQLTKMGVAP